jgi:hypothetical protein
MRHLLPVFAICLALLAPQAQADLCNQVHDKATEDTTKKDVDFYTQLFPDTTLHGNRKWNEIVLECNRKRDTKGKEIADRTATDTDNSDKQLLKSRNLAPQIIRGHYNFYGTVVSQLKYVYVLSKKNGEWQMTIPYAPIINDLIANRIDFNMAHAQWLYDAKQVVNPSSTNTTLKSGARSIESTLCSSFTYFPGKEGKYDNASDDKAYKRDKKNEHISLGLLQYRYSKDSSLHLGCRVDRNKDLFWRADPTSDRVEKVKPDTWILDNFVRTAESYWSIPGVFQLKILLKGHNDDQFTGDVLKLLKVDDHLTVRFATKFLDNGMNQMYKSNVVQLNNFSTMTTDGTYWHEVGHAFGLDDEYGGNKEKKDETIYKDNGCDSAIYTGMNPNAYQMCNGGAAEKHTIYHYLAVSRYITKQNECSTDIACPDGQYCDKGTVTLGKNQCIAKKPNNDGCANGDQCQSGQCSWGHCYQPNSASMGETCFQDGACSKGKCTAVDGFAGKCVCQNDSDCGTGQWCNAGLDFKTNACHAKLNSGEKCGNGNAFGNDHKCKSGKCSGFPSYKCK